MGVLAARHARTPEDDPQAGRAVLEEIRDTLARIEMLAARPGSKRLLALAILAANEAAAAAEEVAARQTPVDLIETRAYMRGQADMLAGLAALDRHLRAVPPT